MSEMIGRLRVALGLETAAFEKGAKRAGAEIDAFGSRAEKAGYKVGVTIKAIAVAGATLAGGALLAGLRGIVDESLRYAESIGRLSQLSGASAEEFQRAAYAARTVGIESDKLADIYKDVNDKVGEFLQTGGGAMKDFFDNIAPKIGVTAEQFRNLSGPQALQLYVESLQKAGVNQQEMTFYLEALASDAAALTPLLRDGGKGFAEFGQEAERAGAVLAEGDISKAGETAAKIRELNASLQVRLTGFVVENANGILALASSLETLAGWAISAANAFRRFKLEQGMREAKAMQTGWFRSDADREQGRRDEQRYRYELAKMDGKVDTKGSFRDYSITGIGALGGAGGVASTVPKAVKTGSGGGRSSGKSAASAATKEADEFTKKLAALQDRLYPEIEALRKYREELDLIAKAFSQNKITAEQAADARRRLAFEGRSDEKAFTEMMADGSPTVDMDKIGEGLDNLFDRMRGFRDKSGALTVQVARSFGDMADDTIQALDRMTSAVQGGGVLNILSAVLGLGLQLGSVGAFGSKIATNINSVPRRAWGGQVNAGQMYMVGERGPEMFVAGAHGSIVPNHRLGGANGGRIAVQVIPSPYFDARVMQNVGVAAPAIVEGGAQTAIGRIGKSNARQIGFNR